MLEIRILLSMHMLTEGKVTQTAFRLVEAESSIRSHPTREISSPKQQSEPNIECMLDGVETNSFPDMEANVDHISNAYIERHNITFNESSTGIITTVQGRTVAIIGKEFLPFSSKNELNTRTLGFHVVPKCIKDVILGAPFLRLTKAFTHFA